MIHAIVRVEKRKEEEKRKAQYVFLPHDLIHLGLLQQEKIPKKSTIQMTSGKIWDEGTNKSRILPSIQRS